MRVLFLAVALLFALPASAQTQIVVSGAGAQNGAATGAQSIAPTDITGFAAGVVSAAPVQSVNGLTGTVVMSFPQFVSGFTPTSPGTVASLISTQPCAASLLGQYGVVSDLFSSAGGTNESMRCGKTGTFFYWQPVRANYAATSTATGGTVTLTPLVTSPTLLMSGTLTSALTISLSTTNAYCGEEFNISTTGIALNLFGITLSGLLGGLTKTLGLTGYQAVYACSSGTNGWQVFP